MKPEKQIKALAELDGYKNICVTRLDFQDRWWAIKGNDTSKTACIPDYLTSYDAIIPLIQKLWQQNDVIGEKVIKYWYRPLLVTPAQLAEALLRAHNLWEK